MTSSTIQLRCEILEYLGLAYHKNKQDEEAIIYLQKAIHINPTSLQLHFNLSTVRKDYALRILNKANKNAKDIECSISELNHAIRSYVTLQQTKDVKSRVFHNLKLLKALENFCRVCSITKCFVFYLF
jgi:tetratricopeptide (TPR) repeat protein